MYRQIVAALLALFISKCVSDAQDVKSKPNVLVIYTDDHRFSGVHALGNQPVKTPHMDSLKDEGVSFPQAYLMGSFVGATCIPSRAMLQTGRHLFDLQHAGWGIPKEHTTMGEAFKAAGYRTHIVGKWHQDKESLARSFDSGDTVMGLGLYLVDHFRMPLWDWDPTGEFNKTNAYLLAYNNDKEIVRRPLTADDKRGPTGTEKDGPHTSEVFAENAVRYIRNHDHKESFFMYLAFHAPHDPRQAPETYKARYPIDEMILPPSTLPQHPFDNGHLVLRDEALAPWPRTEKILKEELSDYYAIITHLDDQIGKVLEALQDTGLDENTLIVFAGDSGLAVGCHGLLGKQNVYDEDGVHIPFIISGKPVKGKGRDIDAFCYVHDIFPTICDLAEIPIPETVSGKSLAPAMNEKSTAIREHTFHAYRQFQRAYRKGDYKLIEYVRGKDSTKEDGEFWIGSRVTQLFNTREDPWETTDLSFLPEYRSKVEELRYEMKTEAERLGDSNKTTGQKYNFWDYYQN